MASMPSEVVSTRLVDLTEWSLRDLGRCDAEEVDHLIEPLLREICEPTGGEPCRKRLVTHPTLVVR